MRSHPAGYVSIKGMRGYGMWESARSPDQSEGTDPQNVAW